MTSVFPHVYVIVVPGRRLGRTEALRAQVEDELRAMLRPILSASAGPVRDPALAGVMEASLALLRRRLPGWRLTGRVDRQTKRVTVEIERTVPRGRP